MAIKRYTANADNTITNAYKSNLLIRGEKANMGASDVLEAFSIYAQASSSSYEYSRILVNFPISNIKSDRTSGIIPSSGSVNFYLKLYNAKHSQTLPRNFTIVASAVSSSWVEGTGLDMENYTDLGSSNWNSSSVGTPWTTPGGDYHSDSLSTFSQTFDSGIEDLSVDITTLVEQWITDAKENYGIGIHLSSSHESDTKSFYTKRFFARGSEFFFKRPVIEAQWNSSKADDRKNIYLSSSLLSSADNINTLYLYNNVGGELKNIPGVDTGEIYVKLYTSSSAGTELTNITPNYPITGGYVSTGVYSASFAVDTVYNEFYDRWYKGTEIYHTGSCTAKAFVLKTKNNVGEFVSSITNLKSSYLNTETGHFRLFIREKNWNPNIYSKAKAAPQNKIIEKAYYKLFRLTDDHHIINYSTGSVEYSKLSFDESGNYFDINMLMLEKNYAYGIKFMYKINNNYYEQPETFKFRVE